MARKYRGKKLPKKPIFDVLDKKSFSLIEASMSLNAVTHGSADVGPGSTRHG